MPAHNGWLLVFSTDVPVLTVGKILLLVLLLVHIRPCEGFYLCEGRIHQDQLQDWLGAGIVNGLASRGISCGPNKDGDLSWG